MSNEDLSPIKSALDDFAPLSTLTDKLKENTASAELEGLTAQAKAPMLANLQQKLGKPIVVICPKDEAAVNLEAELIQYAGSEVAIARPISTAENLVYTEGATDYDAVGQRVRAIHQILEGRPEIVVISIHALLQRTLAPTAM